MADINSYVVTEPLKATSLFHHFMATMSPSYTLLNVNEYHQVISSSRNKLSEIMNAMQPIRTQSANDKIAFISQQLSNIPYATEGAMGEGDWDPQSPVYKGNAMHIQQDPVYRLDKLGCQTFVQMAMALLHATNIDKFDRAILRIDYGAAIDNKNEAIGVDKNDVVHFYNRNNFTSVDFNPVNEKHGTLQDVTSTGDLKQFTKMIRTTITRQNWFLKKIADPAKNVRVFSEEAGSRIADRFKAIYSQLNYPNFYSETASLSYIPKEVLVTKQADGSYQSNQAILNKIPTPSVVEVVIDSAKWTAPTNQRIKDIIGSDNDVPHMGLLYHQIFKQGETIYQQIRCHDDEQQQKAVCKVTPVICQQDTCDELMFAQATDAYPGGYYWYQQDNKFVCSSGPPINNTAIKPSSCNRVELLPLSEYITGEQNNSFIKTDFIIGLHIEKIM